MDAQGLQGARVGGAQRDGYTENLMKAATSQQPTFRVQPMAYGGPEDVLARESAAIE